MIKKVEKNHNIVYKIINTINGSYYYGIHSTNNLEDGYMGSGKVLLKAIKKYGRKSFIKEILFNYPTRSEANEHEKIIVTTDLIKDPRCYNCRTGGENEFYQPMSESTKKKLSEKRKGIKLSLEHNLNKSKAQKGHPKSESFKQKQRGRKMPIDVKKKISEKHLGKKLSEDTKLLISKNNFSSKKCLIEGVIYESQTKVGLSYNITKQSVSQRIKSKKEKWNKWNYI